MIRLGISGFAPMARPGMTVRRLRKRLNASDGAAQDQGVDVVGKFRGDLRQE